MLTQRIRRGLAAGPLAGVLAGLVARAVRNEPAAQATRLEVTQEADPADAPAATDHGTRRHRAALRAAPRSVLA